MKANDRYWYVVLVRSGFAPVVAAELDSLGIPVFSPDTQTANGSTDSEMPALSSVFARFSLQDSQRVLVLPGVLCIAGVPEPVALDDKDIEDLHAAIWAGLPMKVLADVEDLHTGSVLSGPLRGRSGRFVEADGKWHLAVPVPPLEQTFVFAVPASSVNVATGTHVR